MRPSIKQRRGLTLIEVIIATTVFALFAGLISTMVVSALQARISLEKDPQLAEDIRFVTRQILQIADKDEFEQGGDFDTLHNGTISWEADYEETSIIDLFKVQLTFDVEDAEEPIVQEHYLLRPFLSDPVERDALIEDKKSALEGNRTSYSF